MGHNGDGGLFSHLGGFTNNNSISAQGLGNSSGGYRQFGFQQYGGQQLHASGYSPHGYPSGHGGHAGTQSLAAGGATYSAYDASNGHGTHGHGSHAYVSHGHGGYGQHHGKFNHGKFGQHGGKYGNHRMWK